MCSHLLYRPTQAKVTKADKSRQGAAIRTKAGTERTKARPKPIQRHSQLKADKEQTHHGHMTQSDKGAAKVYRDRPFFPKDNPTVNCLGKKKHPKGPQARDSL